MKKTIIVLFIVVFTAGIGLVTTPAVTDASCGAVCEAECFAIYAAWMASCNRAYNPSLCRDMAEDFYSGCEAQCEPCGGGCR